MYSRASKGQEESDSQREDNRIMRVTRKLTGMSLLRLRTELRSLLRLSQEVLSRMMVWARESSRDLNTNVQLYQDMKDREFLCTTDLKDLGRTDFQSRTNMSMEGKEMAKMINLASPTSTKEIITELELSKTEDKTIITEITENKS